MTQARKQRLKEARVWFFQQHFTEKSHVVKAYRVRFGVDRECAMRELCMLKLLSPEKQEMYEKQLAEKEAEKSGLNAQERDDQSAENGRQGADRR